MGLNKDEQREAPKTYLDREFSHDLNFFFICYSHHNKDRVYEMLNDLYDGLMNYWYDIELDPGDLWNQRVESKLRDPHCKGAILFLSEYSLVSEAVRKETDIMFDISKERDFKIIPVIMGYNEPNELLSAVIASNERKQGGFLLNQSGLSFLFRLNLEDRGWCRFEDAKDNILDSLERKEARASRVPSDIDFISIKGERSFLLGKYPLEENGILREIEWINVCHRNDKHFFISKYCLDFLEYTAIDSFLKRIKASLDSMSNKYDVVLLNENFLNEFSDKIAASFPSNYADKNRQQLLRLFWVLAGDGSNKDELVLYNANNCKVKSSIQIDKINAGVRPLLILKD